MQKQVPTAAHRLNHGPPPLVVAHLPFLYHPLLVTDVKHMRLWRLLILIAAVALRLLFLTEVPPGLTHDEADHGLSAWRVVQGDRPLYFTVGYGREPLYDYATASLMAFLGPTFLAGRLAAVYFSLLLLAAAYAWVRRAFNERVALLATAAFAVNFWAVMTARQALRSITLPALFTLATLFWWQIVRSGRLKIGHGWIRDPLALASAFCLGLSFYTYIPARLLWLLFPLALLLWLQFERGAWRATAVMLLIATTLSLPLFGYLAANPSAEVRIGQLRQPLDAAVGGDWSLLWANVLAGLQTLTIKGDSAWRYNLPDRPFLTPSLSLFFLLGVGLALGQSARGLWQRWRGRHSGDRYAFPLIFSLLWLLLGLAPVLVTGPLLSATRAIGIQPILFLFPAYALDRLWDWGAERGRPTRYGTAATLFVVILFAATATETAQSYFFDWGRHPEVRLQYETTLATAVRRLAAQGKLSAALSTRTPDQFHSQPVALLLAGTAASQLRWFNGQYSLSLPNLPQSTFAFSGAAPLAEPLRPFFAPASRTAILPLAADDIDRPLEFYTADRAALLAHITTQLTATPPVMLDDALMLRGYSLPAEPQQSGLLSVITLWEVNAPITADEVVLFTQLLGPDGLPIAQADRLDVPSNAWHAGDSFLQLHTLELPADTFSTPEPLPLIIGGYLRGSGQRLPVTVSGAAAGDFYQLQTLTPVP